MLNSARNIRHVDVSPALCGALVCKQVAMPCVRAALNVARGRCG